MRRITVKEARQQLKEAISRAERGEETLIARRGKPVARLVPAATAPKRFPDLTRLRKSLGKPGTPSVKLIRQDRDAR